MCCSSRPTRYVATALLALLAAGCAGEPALDVRPGTRLLYDVDYLGLDQYPFEVTVVRTAPDLVLDYQLAHDTTSAYGRITVTEQALRDRHRQFNFFSPGRHDYTLRDSTTVWTSDRLYADLAAGRPTPVNLGPDAEAEDTLRAAGREPFPVRIGAARVDVPALVGRTDGGQTLWVWENPDDPVILKIDYGWTIALREAVPPVSEE